MRRTSVILFLAACSAILRAQSTQVEFELMTGPELKHAIHDEGRTTALLFNGGTEQRGPQGVTGAHNLVGRELAREIALKLGNAIVAPILPFSVNNGSSELPGTIGLTGPIFAAVNERVAEQLIANGFRNIVLLGDHGGGQMELAEVAKKLDAKYSTRGIRVVYCGDVYDRAGAEFNKWLVAHDLPVGSHAAIQGYLRAVVPGRRQRLASQRRDCERRGRCLPQERNQRRRAESFARNRQGDRGYEGEFRSRADPPVAGYGIGDRTSGRDRALTHIILHSL
jgi:hypothetical protein